MSEPATRPPVLRIVSGDATPEEVAALLAVLAVLAGRRGGGRVDDRTTDVSTWSDRTSGRRGIRAVFTPSRNGWRTSFWPR